MGFSKLPMGLSCQKTKTKTKKKQAGAKLQRQTLLSSGDTVYKHIDKGHLRASALIEYNHQRKNKEIKQFL